MPLSIRSAAADDAAAVLELVDAVTRETDLFLVLEPGELQMTVEQERQFLSDIAASDNSLFLVAELDGKLAGTLSLIGSKRRALRHVATLGMSIANSHRGQGIGRALLERGIAWAKDSGVVRRIELFVFVENVPALRLYESLGFQHEGRRKNVCYRWGRYLDDFVMGLLIE